jgi:hypothetical protein
VRPIKSFLGRGSDDGALATLGDVVSVLWRLDVPPPPDSKTKKPATDGPARAFSNLR